jgi:hypothetical protein
MKIGQHASSAAPRKLTVDAAEALAIEALGFIAADPDRLERFLSLHGLSPDNLRAAAAQPGFFAAVLDHLAADESLLLAFAENAGHSAEWVARACATLSPPEPA